MRDWAGGDAVLSRSQTTYYGALMVGARGARGEVHCRAAGGPHQSGLELCSQDGHPRPPVHSLAPQAELGEPSHPCAMCPLPR